MSRRPSAAACLLLRSRRTQKQCASRVQRSSKFAALRLAALDNRRQSVSRCKRRALTQALFQLSVAGPSIVVNIDSLGTPVFPGRSTVSSSLEVMSLSRNLKASFQMRSGRPSDRCILRLLRTRLQHRDLGKVLGLSRCSLAPRSAGRRR